MMTILAFVLTLGVIVLIHEGGHFAAARLLGIGVVRFAVGLGNPIWRTRLWGTEVALCPYPFGGYVKLLEKTDETKETLGLPFDVASRARKAVVVASGPLANFVLAVAIFWVMFMAGLPGIKPVASEVLPGSPAAQAGLVPGDEIRAVSGKPVRTWVELEDALERDAGGKTRLLVAGKKELALPLPREEEMKDRGVAQALGIRPPAPRPTMRVAQVIRGSAADKAGILPGDEIIAVGEEKLLGWEDFREKIAASEEKPLEITLERQGKTEKVILVPQAAKVDGRIEGRAGLAAEVDEKALAPYLITIRENPIKAFLHAVVRTGEMTALTFKSLYDMAAGMLSWQNLGGPVTIAQFAKKSMDNGVLAFGGFLAVVSIGIGVLNLLPLPLLDGGHLLGYAAQGVLRGESYDKAAWAAQRLGLLLLFLLIGVALANDIKRLLGIQ